METTEMAKKAVEKIVITDKEETLIKLICAGYENIEIAKKMKLARRTVEDMRYNIHKKLKVKGIARLVLWAVREGIYEVGEKKEVIEAVETAERKRWLPVKKKWVM